MVTTAKLPMRLAWLALFVLLALLPRALGAPAHPSFPPQFVATFNGTQIVSPAGAYSGTAYYDVPNNRSRQDTTGPAGGRVSTLSLYDTARFYSYDHVKQVCTTYYLVGPMRVWAVPRDATYDGSKVVRGYDCSTWHYDFSRTWNEEYSVTKNTSHAPAYYWPVQVDHYTQYSVTYTSFLAQEPQPASLFDLPASWNCPPFAASTLDAATLQLGAPPREMS